MHDEEREFVAGLYQRHAAQLVAALALSTGDRDAAQDLAHDVFLRAAAAEPPLRGHPDARGWLFRTGYNLARNRWRLLLRRKHAIAQQYPVMPVQAWEDTVELRESLSALSRRQRDVIVLHYFNGFAIDEVAEMLGCAEGTVRSHLQRGRVALGEMYGTKEQVNGG